MKRGRVFVAAAVCAVAAFGFAPAHAAVTVEITSPSDGWVRGTFDVTVDATATAGVAYVELFVHGLPAGTDTTAPYEFTVTRPHGQSLFLRATAVANNNEFALSPFVYITVDAVAPTASVTTAEGSVLLNLPSVGEEIGSDGVAGSSSDPSPVASGVASIAVVFQHNAIDLSDTGNAEPDGNGAWSYTPPFALVPGEYTVSATPTDVAGNTGAADTAVVTVV